jgi:hypothetical protein
MELIGHELSRVVYLTNVVRSDGSPFQPEIAQKVIQKYSFVKYPNVDELQKDSFAFSIGKFRDFQIDDLKVYGDGVIVSSKCRTEILSEFLGDLFNWIKADFGLREVAILKPETYVESGIVVRAERDISSLLSPPKRVASLLEQALAKNTGVQYQPTGIGFETDSEGLKLRRRPMRFSLERRVGLPFGTNVFYSVAPLATADHLELLAGLEGLAD